MSNTYDRQVLDGEGLEYLLKKQKFLTDNLLYLDYENGNDENPGTLESPKKTITGAIEYLNSHPNHNPKITWIPTLTNYADDAVFNWVIDWGELSSTECTQKIQFYGPSDKKLVWGIFSDTGDVAGQDISISGECDLEFGSNSEYSRYEQGITPHTSNIGSCMRTCSDGMTLDIDITGSFNAEAACLLIDKDNCVINIKCDDFSQGTRAWAFAYFLGDANTSTKLKSTFNITTSNGIYSSHDFCVTEYADITSTIITNGTNCTNPTSYCDIYSGGSIWGDNGSTDYDIVIKTKGDVHVRGFLQGNYMDTFSGQTIKASIEIGGSIYNVSGDMYAICSWGSPSNDTVAIFDVDLHVGGSLYNAQFTPYVGTQYGSYNWNIVVDGDMYCPSGAPSFRMLGNNPNGKLNINVGRTIYGSGSFIYNTTAPSAQQQNDHNNNVTITCDKIQNFSCIGDADIVINCNNYVSEKCEINSYHTSQNTPEKWVGFFPSVEINAKEKVVLEDQYIAARRMSINTDIFEIYDTQENGYEAKSSPEWIINANVIDMSNQTYNNGGYLFIQAITWMYDQNYLKENNITRNDIPPCILNVGKIIYPLNVNIGGFITSYAACVYINSNDKPVFLAPQVLFHVKEEFHRKPMYGPTVNCFAQVYQGLGGYISGIIDKVYTANTSSTGSASTIYPWDRTNVTLGRGAVQHNLYNDILDCNRIVTNVIYMDYNSSIPTIYIDKQAGSDTNTGLQPHSPFKTTDAALAFCSRMNILGAKFHVSNSDESHILGRIDDGGIYTSDVEYAMGFVFDPTSNDSNISKSYPGFCWFESDGFMNIEIRNFTGTFADFKSFNNVNLVNHNSTFLFVDNVESLTSLYKDDEDEWVSSPIWSKIADVKFSNNNFYTSSSSPSADLCRVKFYNTGYINIDIRRGASYTANYAGIEFEKYGNSSPSPITIHSNYDLRVVNNYSDCMAIDCKKTLGYEGTLNGYMNLHAGEGMNIVDNELAANNGGTIILDSKNWLNVTGSLFGKYCRFSSGDVSITNTASGRYGCNHNFYGKSITYTGVLTGFQSFRGDEYVAIYLKQDTINKNLTCSIDSVDVGINEPSASSGYTDPTFSYADIDVKATGHFVWQGIRKVLNSNLMVECNDAVFYMGATNWDSSNIAVRALSAMNFNSGHSFVNSSVFIDCPTNGLMTANSGNTRRAGSFPFRSFDPSDPGFNATGSGSNIIINTGVISFYNATNQNIIINAKTFNMYYGWTKCSAMITCDDATIGGRWANQNEKVYLKVNKKLTVNGGGWTGHFDIDANEVEQIGSSIMFSPYGITENDVTTYYPSTARIKIGTYTAAGGTGIILRSEATAESWPISCKIDTYIDKYIGTGAISRMDNGDVHDHIKYMIANCSPVIDVHLSTPTSSSLTDNNYSSYTLKVDEIECNASDPLFYAKPSKSTFTERGPVWKKLRFDIGHLHNNNYSGTSLSMTAPVISLDQGFYGCPIEVDTKDNEFMQQLRWMQYYAETQYNVNLKITPEYGTYEGGEKILNSYSEDISERTFSNYINVGDHIYAYQACDDQGDATYELFNTMVEGNYYYIKAFGKTWGPYKCVVNNLNYMGDCKVLGDTSLSGYGDNPNGVKDYDYCDGFVFYTTKSMQPGWAICVRRDLLTLQQQDYKWSYEVNSNTNTHVELWDIGTPAFGNIFGKYEIDKIPAKYLYQPNAKQAVQDAPDYIKGMQHQYFGHGYAIDGWTGYASQFGNQLSSGKYVKTFNHIKNENYGGSDKINISGILTSGDKVLVYLDDVPYIRTIYEDTYNFYIGNANSYKFWQGWNYDKSTDDWMIYIQKSTNNIYYCFNTDNRDDVVYHDVRLFKLLDEYYDANEIETNADHVQEIWVDTKLVEPKVINNIYLSYEGQLLDEILTSADVSYSDGFDGLTPDRPVATLRRAVQLANRYGGDCKVVPVVQETHDTAEYNIYFKHDVYLEQDFPINLYLPSDEFTAVIHPDDNTQYECLIFNDLSITGKGNIKTSSLSLIDGSHITFEGINLNSDNTSLSSVYYQVPTGSFWKHQTDTAPSRTPAGTEGMTINMENTINLGNIDCQMYTKYAMNFSVSGKSVYLGGNYFKTKNLKIKAERLLGSFPTYSSYCSHLDMDVDYFGATLGAAPLRIGPILWDGETISDMYDMQPSNIHIGYIMGKISSDGTTYHGGSNGSWKHSPIFGILNTTEYPIRINIDIDTYDLSSCSVSDIEPDEGVAYGYSPIFGSAFNENGSWIEGYGHAIYSGKINHVELPSGVTSYMNIPEETNVTNYVVFMDGLGENEDIFV